MVSEAILRVETTRWCYLVAATIQFSKRTTSLSLPILTILNDVILCSR
jgi:hypothetical protein